MKKIFLLFAICTIVLSGCVVDYTRKVEYVLKNDSSHEIAITIAPNSPEYVKPISLAVGESASWFKRIDNGDGKHIDFAYTITYDGSVSIEYNDDSKGLMSGLPNWQYERLNDKGGCRYTYIFTDAEYEAVLVAQEHKE